jgi:hypothetical protein
MRLSSVFIFQGHQNNFPSAVFSTFDHAQVWIEQNQLDGILTEYPLDYPIYNWAIDHEYFKVKKEHDQSAKFIAGFSSAYLNHWHFTQGKTD